MVRNGGLLRTMKPVLAVCMLLVGLIGLSPGRQAQAAAVTVGTELVQMTLLPEWRTAPAEGGTFTIALRQTIVPGWHTYWSNPGDSGEPTQVSWGLPDGGSAAPLAFPHAKRIPYGPLVNFGYEGEVVFLAEITLPGGLEPGSNATITADILWLVCEEICIPEEVSASFSLPVTAGAAEVDREASAVIAAARDALPQPAPWFARYAADKDAGSFTLALDAPETAAAFASGLVEQVVFFPYEDGVIVNADPQNVVYGPDGFAIATGLGWKLAKEEVPGTVSGVLVIVENQAGTRLERAVIVTAEPGAIPAAVMLTPLGDATGETGASGGSFASIGIGQALLFALIGGLILNIMPCVFPVLFMKAFGFVKAAQDHPGAVRLHGLLFTLGVVVSFLAVAGLLIALRAGGAQIGWGFQLQDPLFITVLIYLLLVVGLNLSGVFEIGQSLTGIGSDVGGSNGALGAFLTGVLAAVVATPCVAPFMGAAIGFGLSQPVPVALGVFAALGLGMAAPWLLLSFFPGLFTLLPKPGAWMETAKHLLAFPVYATAAWLLWVLTQQVDSPALAAALAGAVLLSFAAWSWGAGQGGKLQPLAIIAAVLAFAGAVWLVTMVTSAAPVAAPASSSAGPDSADFEPYDEARLAALRAEGTPVLLNATAAWCITCLVNERVALSQPAVVARLESDNIIYMKADWTNRDPAITRLLESFGRNGVPLYVYYPANAEPVVLPQILTERIVLDTLQSAGG